MNLLIVKRTKFKMENNKLELPTKADLRKVPCNETVDSVIVDVHKTTWLDIFGATKLMEYQKEGKFDNVETQIVVVVKTDSNGFFREENFTFDTKYAPTDRSKYGRFVTRYGVPTVGAKVSVDFDAEGKSVILLNK